MKPVSFDDLENCIAECDPALKCAAVDELKARTDSAGFKLDHSHEAREFPQPGRPLKPELVAPAQLKRRRLGSRAGRGALVHAVAHIEFNAINLALDAAYRFRGLPAAFYSDWLNVAWDEARHFRWLSDRLEQLGLSYGDLPAHNGLWEMALRTAHSGLVRMALVPRVLEARGLDVTPGMIGRLSAAGDQQTVAILRNILVEEVRHVEVGSRWFEWFCGQQGMAPEATFMQLLDEYYGGRIKGPINRQARLQAGFKESELCALTETAQT